MCSISHDVANENVLTIRHLDVDADLDGTHESKHTTDSSPKMSFVPLRLEKQVGGGYRIPSVYPLWSLLNSIVKSLLSLFHESVPPEHGPPLAAFAFSPHF